MIDCQTGLVLHKYKVPGEVSARAPFSEDARFSSPEVEVHATLFPVKLIILVGMEPSASGPVRGFASESSGAVSAQPPIALLGALHCCASLP